MEIFFSNDGNEFLSGRPDYFSSHFDWQITIDKICARTNKPKTVYIKTDFLPGFVNNILPNMIEPFILITSCSDYSPEINFNREYQILINHNLISYWFMQNMKTKTDKSFSLPQGVGSRDFLDSTPKDKVDEIIINARNSQIRENKIDKVFCSFRDRGFNVCGEDMIIRPKILEVIKDRTDIFDFYDNTLPFEEFVNTISKYKYSLCPHGNGMDPSPNAWISLAVKTTPVIYKIPNTIDQFQDTDSVIFFEKFEDLLDKNLFKTKPEVDFNFLTNNYWAIKILSKISY